LQSFALSFHDIAEVAVSDKEIGMFRSFSLYFLAFMPVFSAVAASSAEPQRVHATAVPITIVMSRSTFSALIKKGNFDSGRCIRAMPAESVKFGKRDLWLVHPAREFKDVSEVVAYLNSIGLEPAGLREMLELAVQKPELLKNGETVYAFGSPAKLPSGEVSWQCCGKDEKGRFFLSDVVKDDGRKTDPYYLAKRIPTPTK
jgi:hypothetical protein